MEAVVVLHRLRFLDYFCPKQGQDFKPSAAPIYPNMGEVPPPPGDLIRPGSCCVREQSSRKDYNCKRPFCVSLADILEAITALDLEA